MVELRVLGPLELRTDGRRLDIGAAKQRALLALLLLEPNLVIGRDRLIDQLWDGTPPPSAKATLHSCVYRLRKLLGEDATSAGFALHTRPAGYLFEVPADAVDLYRFERLVDDGARAYGAGQPAEAVECWRAGLVLWRGEAFADITLQAVRDRASRLDELRLDTVERCLLAELALGRHDTIVAELETLVSEHPLRERLWELLITALYRSGRQADTLDAYQRVHKVLDAELGVEPGRAIRDLHQQILRSDPGLDSTAGLVSAAPAVPRQLPAAVGDFTGRTHDLARLDAMLPEPGTDATTVVISAIAGAAGIGKTSLAVHWAHRVVDHFPDGQLYVNLRGFDPSGPPMSASEALRGLLDALRAGQDRFGPDRVPSDLDAQIGMYRSLLAGKRMLVVLDNARDADQVRPLLPGTPGSLVLVTSRNQLSGLVVVEGARPLTLDLMSLDESRQFLANRLGADRTTAEPDAVDAIIERCARLPLGLAIAAARAVTHPEFELAAVADELDEFRAGLDGFCDADPHSDVRSVFSWSYDALSQDAARLFRLLGPLARPDVSTPAAASLLGSPIGRTRQLLQELTRSHLLTEHSAGRYGSHDLLRAYASELLDAEPDTTVRQRATQRLLDHYLHTAHAAAESLYPQRESVPLDAPMSGTIPEAFDDHGAALDWFTTHRSALLTAIELAADNGMDAHVWQLTHASQEFLDRQGYWNDLVTCQRLALSSARRTSDRPAQANTHRSLAAVQARLGRYSKAHKHFREALQLSHELGDHTGQAHTHRTYAWVVEQQNDYVTALRHAGLALELFDTAGHRVGAASALNDAGWYHAHLGDFEQALTCCRQALALFQELEHLHGQAATWESLGYTNAHLDHHERAVTCFQHALDLYRDLGIRYYEAETLDHLGDVYRTIGSPVMARVTWEQAIEILDELGDRKADEVRAKLDGRLSNSSAFG